MFILQSEASSTEVHVEGINSYIIFFYAKDKRKKVAYLLESSALLYLTYLVECIWFIFPLPPPNSDYP